MDKFTGNIDNSYKLEKPGVICYQCVKFAVAVGAVHVVFRQYRFCFYFSASQQWVFIDPN